MLFDENVSTLQKNPLHWIGPVTNEEKLEVLGLNTIVNNESKSITILENHLDGTIELNANYKKIYFIIGLYGIDEIKSVLKRIHPSSYIVIIEPNTSLLSATLNLKDLSIFNNYNNILFCDDIAELSEFLAICFSVTDILGVMKNFEIYLTEYYRENDLLLVKRTVKIIHDVIRDLVMSFGNSVNDSLDGLRNNLKNLNWLTDSSDVTKLKGSQQDKPVVIIAAGPSLDKNLDHLIGKENDIIIIAVDTVLKKVLQKGIIPHFVCSVERLEIVYEYFYENVDVPDSIKFVGPPLVDPRIIEKFKGNLILPFRKEVAEYKWIKKITNYEEDNNIPMGLSCAHVAFGFAMHLGASPIILIGQDLAYGEAGNSHTGATIYDEKIVKDKKEAIEIFVDGYYGGMVKTTEIWKSFKFWFERQIKTYNLNVIDATEGGAKIEYTTTQNLDDFLNNLSDSKHSIMEVIDRTPKYNISKDVMINNLIAQKETFEKFSKDIDVLVRKIDKIKLTKAYSQKQLKTLLELFKESDGFIMEVIKDSLLVHNLQSILIKALWDVNALPQQINFEVMKAKRNIHLKVLLSIILCIEQINNYIDDAIKGLANVE